MTTAHELTTGHPDTDNLLDEANKLRERIMNQAEILSEISRSAIDAACSPAAYDMGLPLTGTEEIEKFLMAQALANIAQTDQDNRPKNLDLLVLSRLNFDERELAGTCLDYGYDIDMSGFPPTYFSQDLIRWTDELAKNGWSVLAQMDTTLPEEQRFEVTIYPDSEQAREFLDEHDRTEEVSRWLSERVLLRAHQDDLDQFDWTGAKAAEAQVA